MRAEFRLETSRSPCYITNRRESESRIRVRGKVESLSMRKVLVGALMVVLVWSFATAGRFPDLAAQQKTDRRGEREESDRRRYRVLLNKGDEHFKEAEFEEAREAYSKAVQIVPQEPEGKLRLGLALFTLSEFVDGATEVREGLELTEDWDRIPDPSTLYPSKEGFRDFLRRVYEVVGQDPPKPNGVFLLGYCYTFSGDKKRAKATLEYLQKVYPTDELITRLLERVSD